MRRILSPLIAAIACGCAALLFQGAAVAQTRELATKGALLDRVAAVVNDGVVLNSELDDQIAIVSERLRAQKLELPPRTCCASRYWSAWCCRKSRCSGPIARI